MPFNPDFEQANAALSRASTAFMQDWVGRRNDQRSMEYLNRSGEMWNEKSKADADLEVNRMQEQSRLSQEGELLKFKQDIAKFPELKAMMSFINYKRMMGEDTAGEMKQLSEGYEAISPGITRLTEQYITGAPEQISLFGLYEPGASAGLVQQAMTNKQGEKELGFKWEELDFNRSKEGQTKADNFQKGYLKKVSDLRDFYTKIRNGNTVVTLDPVTKMPIEINKAQMSPDQLKGIDDMLTQMARIETKFLNNSIDENDAEWIDQGWDYSSKSIAMTNAFARKETEKDKTFDQITEEEYSNLMRGTGRVDRQFGIGAPVEDALDEATDGELTFDPATPIELKKLLCDTYKDLKAQQAVTEDGKPFFTDANIWAMIMDDEEIGDIAKRYVRKKPKMAKEAPAVAEKKKTDATSGGR